MITSWRRNSGTRLPNIRVVQWSGVGRWITGADLDVFALWSWLTSPWVVLPSFASALHKDRRAPRTWSPWVAWNASSAIAC
jgi:hypothetical protein